MLTVGQKLPKQSLTVIAPTGNGDFEMLKDQDSHEYFSGNKTVVVSIPGAFTPTCTANHIPSFNEKLQEFTDKGVQVVGLTVNDAFVTQAFANALNVNFPIIADGSGTFTKELDAEVDLTAHGLGIRGRRFTMLVDNDTITKVNDEGGPGYTDVSKVDTALSQI